MFGELKKMKTFKTLSLAAVLFSLVSLIAAEKTFSLPTVPGTDKKCRMWKDDRYKTVADGIALLPNKLCYNASVLPVAGAQKVRVSFKYKGKSTRCGLFFYSHNSGLRKRELVYLPNCDKMKEFQGEFDIPPVIDKRKIVGIRLVFQTDKQGTVSDASVTLL